ncbi:hypothetical protein BGZ83_009041 [Gryganskiella cystojenkinii]|nr:hypothetical protein BGZ83_009041 [Gryganskiella cystojenkinii]
MPPKKKNKVKRKATSSGNLGQGSAGSSTSQPQSSTSHSIAVDTSSQPVPPASATPGIPKADIATLRCLVNGHTISKSFRLTLSKVVKPETVEELRTIIHSEKPVWFKDLEAEDLTLWRVSIPFTDDDDQIRIKLSDIPTVSKDVAIDSNMKKKLSSATPLSKALSDGLADGAVHIVVELHSQDPIPTSYAVAPAQVHGSLLPTFRSDALLSVCDIIKQIVSHLPRLHATIPGDIMPLKDRDFTPAVRLITHNVKFRQEGSDSKSNFHMIVSGGAPGIGKTRFGKELFSHLAGSWLPPEWAENNLQFEYLKMDFGNGIALNMADNGCDNPSIIIGHRIAYCFFIEGKYEMTFQRFQALIEGHINLFTIDRANVAILEHLGLPEYFDPQDPRRLFLFLHIDEFQLIDKWDVDNATRKHLQIFKDMIRCLAIYMQPPATNIFVQTFLSGTAPQAIIAAQEPSRTSFGFVRTPLLSSHSMFEIAGHYAEKYGAEKYDCGAYKWKLCRQFLEVLEDTGGLPRALELLFGQCFLLGHGGKGFFRGINNQNFNTIFTNVKNGLQTRYKIYGAVAAKKKLALMLLHTSITGRPVIREELMDPDDENSAVARLEQDAHIILDACNSSGTLFTIKMPLFFVCLYNDILRVVDYEIQERLRVRSGMPWQDWEIFVANFEVFRNNLLINLGRQTAHLSELYPGAFGTPNTLDLEVKLERLSVRQAKEQFPSRTLTDRITAESIPWEHGKDVIVNDKSAAWGDAFVARETTQGDKIVNIHQDKFYYNSAEFTLDHLSDEHQKNLDGSNSAKLNLKLRKTLASYRHITIIFTTQPFVGEVKRDDRLVISMDNFKEYFGPVFAVHANFALTRINPNFLEQARMKEYIPGISDVNAPLTVAKRPFTSLKDFYKKIPRAKTAIKKYEDDHPGKKVKLDFYPFN